MVSLVRMELLLQALNTRESSAKTCRAIGYYPLLIITVCLTLAVISCTERLIIEV